MQKLSKKQRGKTHLEAHYKQKISKVMINLIPILIILGVILVAALDFTGDTLYAEVSKTDQTGVSISDGSWFSMGFILGYETAQAPMVLDGLSLALTKSAGFNNHTGYFNVSIFAVDGNNHPTGSALSRNSTVNVSDWSTADYTIWENITMPAYTLQNGTNYSIVLSSQFDNAIGGIQWARNSTLLNDHGKVFKSEDNGANWIEYGGGVYTTNFRVYGGEGIGTGAIVLDSPANASTIQTTGANFTANYSVDATYNMTNATYYIWYSNRSAYNITTTVAVTNTTNTSTVEFLNFPSGNYVWNVYGCWANATFSNCTFAPNNFSTTATLFSATNAFYDVNVFETSNNNFNVNITTDPLINSVSGVLWYNGTSYTSSIVEGTGGVYRTYNNIDIPLTTATANKTFLWEFTFVLTTGATSLQNTSIYSHSVNKTFIELCSNYTQEFINFTTKNAVNPFPILNASFKSAWSTWLGGGTVKRYSNWENTSELNNTFNFCMYPIDKTFQTDASIEFDAAGYAQNYHYLTNASISNVSQLINLYLLNDSAATLTVLRVQDGAQNRIANASIQIQLYDIGTGTYYTVAMAKTSFNGEDLAYLNWYDSFYKFIITKDGSILKIADPYKISETPQIFEIITDITYPYDKYGDFVYTLNYNNATGNFVLTYTRPSGLPFSG